MLSNGFWVPKFNNFFVVKMIDPCISKIELGSLLGRTMQYGNNMGNRSEQQNANDMETLTVSWIVTTVSCQLIVIKEEEEEERKKRGGEKNVKKLRTQLFRIRLPHSIVTTTYNQHHSNLNSMS